MPHNLDLVKVRPVCGEIDLAGLTSLILYHMRTNCRPGMSQGAKLARLQSQDERSHNLHQDIDVLTAAVKISDGARGFSCSSGAVCSRSHALPGPDWLTIPFVLSVLVALLRKTNNGSTNQRLTDNCHPDSGSGIC